MSVSLRLARHGSKKRPYYRVVATPRGTKRDGRFIEIIGTYNPLQDPPAVNLKEDKVKHWIEQGAQPTEIVRSLIKSSIPGFLDGIEASRRSKIQEKRKQRKARSASK